jgi:hypothetical protein
MANPRNMQNRAASQDSKLLLKAVSNTLDLLGDGEQKQNVFRFLQIECGITFDSQPELDEKKVSAAFADLFGRGGELLIRRLKEEIATLRAKSQTTEPIPSSADLETLH